MRPNVRSSGGYGAAFRKANIEDWGGMEYRDLMTGVNFVVGMGVADPDSLRVMGWSYGRYWQPGSSARPAGSGQRPLAVGSPIS